MSYHIYLVPPEAFGHSDCEPGCLLCAATVEVGSYTYNVSPMWWDAVGATRRLDDGREVGGIAMFHGAPGCEAAGPLSEAVERLKADPEKYRAMNPKNGWGDYESATRFLEHVARACVQLPSYRLDVS